MSSLPVVLVLHGGPPPELGAALELAGFTFRSAQPGDAAASVSSGWAELVVCERVPGWQALIARVEGTGGAAVLLGPPVDGAERRQMLPAELEAVSDPESVPEALRRAAARLEARRNGNDSEELLERARTAELVNRFAQSIATQIDVPEVIGEAIARTRDLCDADGASLLLVDPARGDLFFDTVAGGASGRIERVRLSPGQGIAGRVAQTAEPLWIPDVQQSADFAHQFDAITGFTTGSIVAVPLLLSGDVLGVLEAVRGTDRPPFAPGHLRRLQALAPHVTIAVHNAEMTSRLRESQAQVLRANEALEAKVEERTAQIARGKREWEQTFDAIHDPIAIQEGHTLVRVNDAYAQAVGLPLTTIPGRRCYEVMGQRTSPCPGCPLGVGAAAAGELELGGRSYDVAAFHRLGGEARRAVVTYRDVTERRALQAQVRESERLVALGQLASGAAHEINNPLGFITANLRSLRDLLEDLRTPPPESAAELIAEGVQTVEESLDGADRVGRIVRALRELARQEIGRAEPCDPNASVSRVVHAELGGASTQVALELQAQARPGIVPLQLDQLLAQLLRNARQAIGEGGRIGVRTRDVGGGVELEVEDDGGGIAPEHLHRVFEPFFTTRGIGGGIGLGLTAAYGIVRRHGGRIDVRSRPGGGATFTVWLPSAEGRAAQADSATFRAEASSIAS